MFDFNCIISNQGFLTNGEENNLSSFNFLKGISYEKISINGNYFTLKGLKHSHVLSEDFYSKEENTHVFVLGNVFTNFKYEKEFGASKKLYANDLLHLYRLVHLKLSSYIKGVYLLLIFDETKMEYDIVSSRSGLLDLYYYQGDNQLILSTSIEYIIKSNISETPLDEVSLLQYHIFDYPLGNRTLYKGIFLLDPAKILNYNLKETKESTYFNFAQSLDSVNTISWQETWKQIPQVFNKVLDLIHNQKESFCSAITSGFDSRTNLSRLKNSGKDILFYSWGMPGSIELRIPMKISRKIDINYIQILLNEEFEKDYAYYAKQAILWSNGRATNRRANHNYAYSKLSKHSDLVITGLIGSELIRPTNAVDHIFNQAFIDVFYSENIRQKLEHHFQSLVMKGVMKTDWLENVKQPFIDQTNLYFSRLEIHPEKYIQLYYFALTEGFRKYFGHEINGSRIYSHITSPYIDDDFVDFLLKTPVPALNKNAFERNPKTLKLGQLFYIPIIKTNLPALLKLKTGRYYSPSSLTSAFYPLSVLPGYLWKYLKQRITPNDTFNTKKWNNIFLEENSSLALMDSRIFEPITDITISSNRDIEISKYISIRYMLKMMQ